MDKYFTGESIDFRQVIAIIIPILVDQAFIVCLNMFNTAMISSSGVTAVSAVNIVDSINVFLLNVFIAISTGGTVIVAQYKGTNDSKMVSRSAASTISVVGLLTIVVATVMIIFHNPILNLLFGSADANVLSNARLYFIGSCLSYPCFAIFEAVCGALRGVSDTKSSLVLSMITNISYVVLNILFINVFKMGVLGMIISVNIARFLGMVCSIIYMLKFNTTVNVKIRDIFKIDFAVQKKIFLIGMPFAAEQMFFNGGKILTQTFIVSLGTLAITVNAISGSIGLLMQIGANALSLSVITVVGQCMGRRDINDAKKFIKSFVGLGTITFIIGDIIILPLFPFIVQLFNPPQEIVHTIFNIVLLTGIVQPFLWSISFICPSALRATGDAKFTSITSMLSMWLFRVTLGYLLGIVLKFGITGVWCAMLAEWGVRGIIFTIRFKSNKWCSHNLISDHNLS